MPFFLSIQLQRDKIIKNMFFFVFYYNMTRQKMSHTSLWGLGRITGGEYISRLVEMPQRKVCLWQTLIEGIINI
jgi:hypothetical protein